MVLKEFENGLLKLFDLLYIFVILLFIIFEYCKNIIYNYYLLIKVTRNLESVEIIKINKIL